MVRKAKILAFLAVAYCNLASGQPTHPTVLLIDVQNHVEFQDDISDVTKFATIPTLTPSVNFRDFSVATVLADIVAINGQPAKGLYAARARSIISSPTPSLGKGAIADVSRAAIREEILEILSADGTTVGTIVSLGLSGGPAPPGAPAAQAAANFAIVGGTGAFVGMRGTSGSGPSPQGIPARAASMSEDPANRRVNGGGITRRVLTLYPMAVPQVLAITHSSDFAPVSTVKPALAGEILSVFASGLGPTRPGVDPGQPFPSGTLDEVNSPVQVTVDGKVAELIGAVGLPGTVDGYQVNFRMPARTGKSSATIQLSAAWIAGTAVTIAVQ